MNVILSIKPEYCDAIREGRKKYEFRRRVFRIEDRSDLVFMYATAPVSSIVGAFMVERIIHGRPRSVWAECKGWAGISEQRFFQYFQGVSEAHAIQIGNVRTFEPVDLSARAPGFTPPQSFCYTDDCLKFLFRAYARAGKPGNGIMAARQTIRARRC